jgi:hypothetical protein
MCYAQELLMTPLQKKFGYNLTFCEKQADQQFGWKDFSHFAAADTAEEAIVNLRELLQGSTPLNQSFANSMNVRLTKFELVGGGKRLLHFDVGTGDTDRMAWLLLGVGGMLGDPWKSLVFDNVNRELLAALMTTFPAQKQHFKGKHLEDSLGL